MLLGSELKNKLILDESIYRLPMYKSITKGEIAIEYASFRYERKEMAKLAKQYLRKKQDKYDLDVLNNYVTLQQDTFDLSSEVGIYLSKLNAYLISAQKEIDNSDNPDEIKIISGNVKKEYENFIKILNNNTKGIVDAVIWYSIDEHVAYPMYDSGLRDILTLGITLKGKYPESLKYIIYE